MVRGRAGKNYPPDGGWGWLVCIGMALMFIVTVGTVPSFGLIFGDFIHNLGEGTTSVAAIISVYMSVCNMTGLVANTLSKIFSFRQIGSTGAVLLFLGSLSASFATNVSCLICTYGLLQGLGLGLMIPAAFSSFNSYFDRRRTSAMAMSQAINGIGSLLIPLFIRFLLRNFAFRGAQFIVSAVTLHALLGMMCLQPVEKFMARNAAELGVRYVDSSHRTPGETEVVAVMLEDGCEEKQRLHKLSEEEYTTTEKADGMVKDSINNPDIPEEPLKLIYACDSKKSTKDSKAMALMNGVVSFLDLTLLKDLTFVNLSVGVSFTHFADSTFFALQPIYLKTLGFSQDDVAVTIAVSAAGDLVGRLFLSIVGGRFSRRNRLIFWIGCLGTSVNIFVFIHISNYTAINVVTGILGFFRGCIYVAIALVFAEHVPIARYPAAFGLHHAISGIIFFVFGPSVGFVRDATGSYGICFTVLSLMMSMCVTLWAAEVAYYRMRKYRL